MRPLLQIITTFKQTLLCFFLCVPLHGIGQDLEAEAKGLKDKVKGLKDAPKKMLEAGISVNGSIASNTTFYQSNALVNARLPFESILSGNLNFDLFGKIKMPFTFSFNSQNINFTHPFNNQYRFQQPFNRYQFKPTYKGLTLILGVGSMTFSPFTLNGRRFEGVGIQFKPKKLPFFLNIMLGNLQKSVRIDTTLKTGNNTPAYGRNGFGVQLGFKKKQSGVDLILFKAADDPLSLPYNLDSLTTPQANVVMSFKGNTLLKDKLSLMAEFAYSGITQDNRNSLQEPLSDKFSFFKLLPTNRSTFYKKAFKTAIAYKAKTMNLGLEYSRIDPKYQTLGAYYFVNDQENITANVGAQLMNGKLMIASQLGRQRNNLENTESQNRSQWVGNMTLNYVPSENLVLNATYSNFSSFTNLRTDLEYLTTLPVYAGLDTLNYRQINQNLMLNMMKVLAGSTKEIKKTLLINGMFQNSLNAQGGFVQNATIFNANTQYTHANQPRDQTYGLGFTLTRNDIVLNREWLVGPSLSFAQSFLKKKLKTNLGLNFLKTFKTNNANNAIFNARISGTYALEKHSISTNLMFMYQNVTPLRSTDRDLWNMLATLSYQYSLSYKKSFLKKPKDSQPPTADEKK